MNKQAFSSFCGEYVHIKEANGRIPTQEKVAFVEPLSLIIGAAQGLGRGRAVAGQTAAAMAPKGRVGRSEEVARQAATFGSAAGVIGGLGLLRHYQADKVLGSMANKAFPRGLIASPSTQQAVISAIAPAVAATVGGMAAGLLTGVAVGGVQQARGPLYGKKEKGDKEGTKEAAELTPQSRAEIKPKNFALTGKQSNTGQRAYPIHDEQHARAALGFVGMHGTPQQKSEVYKDISKKYPHLAAKSSIPELKGLTEKKAGVVGRLAKNMGHGPVSNFLVKHENPIELAGLGVLAAPSVAELHHAAKQHQMGGPVNKGEVAKGVAETAGLGILAAPVVAHMLRGGAHG